MSSLPFDDRLLPLTTDARIEERVGELIGRAHLRQLWLLFVDDDDMQLPLVMPIEDFPNLPVPDETAQIIDNVGEIMARIDAAGLILVWERYGSGELTSHDRLWIRHLVHTCAVGHVPLRAVLLSHRNGVRWVTADDWID